MCIIVSKEKGIELPMMEVFKRCFTANPDGAGIMYASEGEVHIRKGFMEYEAFEKELNALKEKLGDLTDVAMAFHFRISTAGNVDGGNCHPYPIVDNEAIMRRHSYDTDLGFMHNGILREWDPPKGSVINDSMTFARDCASLLKDAYGYNMLENPRVYRLVDKERETSRFCFLDKDGNMTLFGSWEEDYNGVMFSNTSYLPYAERYGYYSGYTGYTGTGTSCSGYDKLYDNWYDYYDWDDGNSCGTTSWKKIGKDTVYDKKDEAYDKLLEDISMGELSSDDVEYVYSDITPDFEVDEEAYYKIGGDWIMIDQINFRGEVIGEDDELDAVLEALHESGEDVNVVYDNGKITLDK
jgi:hypothetical protein